MYSKNFILFVAAAASTVSASIVAERAIQARDNSNGGWSLQSSSPVDGFTACGTGAYCPSSGNSICVPASQSVAAACCPSSNKDCRGAVEGSPSCADASWNLWKNDQGNGFCCAAGQIGIKTTSSAGAGTCVGSLGGSDAEAQFVTSGTGSVPTNSIVAVPSSTAASESSTTTTMAGSTTMTTATGSASATTKSSTSESSTATNPCYPASKSATATASYTAIAPTATANATVKTNSTSTGTGTSATATPSMIGSNGAMQNGVTSGLMALVGGLALAFAL